MQGTPPSGGGAADGPDAEARGAGRLQRQEEAGSCRGRGRVEIAAAETPARAGPDRVVPGRACPARARPRGGQGCSRSRSPRIAAPPSRPRPRPRGSPRPRTATACPDPAPGFAPRRAAPPPGPRPGLPVGRSSTTTGAACRKDTSTTASAASSSCDPSPPSRSAPPTPGSAGGENQPTPTDVHRRVRREAGTKWPTASFGAPPPGRHRAVGGVAGRGRVT